MVILLRIFELENRSRYRSRPRKSKNEDETNPRIVSIPLIE